MADPGLLYPTTEIWIESPHRAFGLLLSPRYTVHDDFDAAYDQQAVKKTGCIIDHNARVLMGRPTPMLADTLLSNWTSSGTGWHDDAIDPDTGKRFLLMDDATTDHTVGLTSQFEPAATDAYFVKILKGPPSTDATHDGTNCYVTYTIGTSADGTVIYQVEQRLGQPFTLTVSKDSGATFNPLRYTDTIDDSEQYLRANNRAFLLTVLPVPQKGTVSVYIGNGDGDLSFTADTALFPQGAQTLASKNGKVAMAWFHCGFPTSWTFNSATHDITFTPTVDPTARVWPDGKHHASTPSTPAYTPWVSGESVSITAFPDPDLETGVKYTITASAPATSGYTSGYSNVTPMIEYAQIDYPPVTYNDTFSVPVLMNPMELIEEHILDWNNLDYTQTAQIVCDNSDGRWSFSSGMRAISIARGWNGNNIQGMVGWVGETVGYHRGDPMRTATFRAFDRSFPLRRKKCGILPPMDGWCIYAAIRFLASLGGITEDRMINVPACDVGPCPPNCSHPLLPVGTGVKPRMRPNPTSPLWLEMNRIRQFYRHTLGFDDFGYLIFEPYDPVNNPAYTGAFGGYFTLQPEFQMGVPLLNEITGGLDVEASVQDVRSSITLVGIDPGDNWTPIVVHADNESVVFDPTDPAFLGFRDDWVEVDPVFTNQQFMEAFAQFMLQQVGLPTVNTEFQAYLQPSLSLLNQFGVYEPLTLGTYLFNCFRMRHRIAYEGNQWIATTNIRGKSRDILF